MRAVIQRSLRASVSVAGEAIGRIDHGLVVFVGVAAGDGPADIDYIASKICEVRVFHDEAGRMNRSVAEAGGGLLVVSEFTLLADARKGRRPAFDAAEAPEPAERVYDAFVQALRASGLPVETGRFRADMKVELINDGPVTILLDSKRLF